MRRSWAVAPPSANSWCLAAGSSGAPGRTCRSPSRRARGPRCAATRCPASAAQNLAVATAAAASSGRNQSQRQSRASRRPATGSAGPPRRRCKRRPAAAPPPGTPRSAGRTAPGSRACSAVSSSARSIDPGLRRAVPHGSPRRQPGRHLGAAPGPAEHPILAKLDTIQHDPPRRSEVRQPLRLHRHPGVRRHDQEHHHPVRRRSRHQQQASLRRRLHRRLHPGQHPLAIRAARPTPTAQPDHPRPPRPARR